MCRCVLGEGGGGGCWKQPQFLVQRPRVLIQALPPSQANYGATRAVFITTTLDSGGFTPKAGAAFPLPTAYDCSAGFCTELAATEALPVNISIDDFFIYATTCVVGYYNPGTGACVSCPAGSYCLGGNLNAASLPRSFPVCGPACTASCILPSNFVCAASCSGSLLQAPAGVFVSAMQACSFAGSGGTTVVGFDFDDGRVSAQSGAQAATAVLYASAPLGLSPNFFSAPFALQMTTPGGVDYLDVCFSSLGYDFLSFF